MTSYNVDKNMCMLYCVISIDNCAKMEKSAIDASIFKCCGL